MDKTDFIREWWENGDDVTLIARPCRFGKTLNMSMLECFFSNRYRNREDLFEGLSNRAHRYLSEGDCLSTVEKKEFDNVNADMDDTAASLACTTSSLKPYIVI